MLKLNTTTIGIYLYLLTYSSGFCQNSVTYTFPDNFTYKNVKIYPFSGPTIFCKQLTILPDSNTIKYIDKETHQEKSLDLKSIDSIKFKSGTKAVSRGLWGHCLV